VEHSNPARGGAARRVARDDLHRFSSELLVAGGTDPRDASTVSDVLVWGDRHGRHEYGVARIPEMLRRVAAGLIRTPANLSWSEVGDAAVLLDAGDGFGQVASIAAVDAAGELATRRGVGACVVRNSNHFGAAGAYVERAAAGGLVALAFSNAFPKVAPHGGTGPALGTNPIALGCPTSGAPIVVDLATSAQAGSTVRAAQRASDDVPDDATTGPRADVLLPAAGPKGTALALAVEVLTGALACGVAGPDVGSIFGSWDRPVGASHCFVVFAPARFGTLEGFIERVDRTVAAFHESPPAPGFPAVRVPGERGDAAARLADRFGVDLPDAVDRELAALARELHVTPPA